MKTYSDILAALRAKRDELDQAIAVIATLAGDETNEQRAETKAAKPATKTAKRAPKASRSETKARPTPAPDRTLETRILTALKAGNTQPKAIRAATHLSIGQLYKGLNSLVAQKVLTKSGSMRNVQYALTE